MSRPARGNTLRLGSLQAAAVVLALSGCGSPGTRPIRPEYDLHDPSGTRRSTAIATVVKQQDRSQVPALIELLDDEDPAVRMQASGALKALTGHDTGYRPYADPLERHRHVESWRAWSEGKTPRPIPPPPMPTPAPRVPRSESTSPESTPSETKPSGSEPSGSQPSGSEPSSGGTGPP